MKTNGFQQYTEEIVSSMVFAWTMMKPELLQTIHSLALQSVPATLGIAPPAVDTTVKNIDMGIGLRPSEMQNYFITAVIPTILVGLQSIAEETLNNHFGNTITMAPRLRKLRQTKVIDAQLASEAHFWRLVRNVLIHGGGRITQSTQDEARKLLKHKEINFSEFSLWGPLLDSGGGVLVPMTPMAKIPPYAPNMVVKRTQIVTGNQIEVGLGDVLAAGSVWDQILARVT